MVDPKVIDASPTKDFFISILVRDIKLVDAVSDLIDNCVDGARRLRADGDYTGLHISVEITPDHFMIADNCGGISAQIAREYAFKFGRPLTAKNTPHSIGQFGVGMKRAFFKIGSVIKVESVAPDSQFTLDIDVDKWKSPDNVDENGKEKWDFSFTELEEGLNNPIDKCQTILLVSNLHEGIANEFKLENFRTRLIDTIEAAHQKAIESGLAINVNEIELKYRQSSVLYSERIRPLSKNFEINLRDKPVKVKIFAGISDAKLSEAGWYVFCNDRLILRADKSQITGWDQEVNGVRTPKPHYQFSRFRGYVFFDADDASILPWNTTKNGVDIESELFQSIRLEMFSAMRPVLDFLNLLDNELDTENTVLQEQVKNAEYKRLRDLPLSEVFAYPTGAEAQAAPPKEGRVSYLAPYEKIQLIKELTSTKSNTAAGQATFYYYLKSMGEE